MDIQSAIKKVIAGEDLLGDEMTDVMQQIMTGQCTDSQIGGFLVGLRIKGETVTEVAAAASVMRELSESVSVDMEHLVDTAGTGGDTTGSFNISTAAAIVAAGGGARVAKHGNRSMTSKSGSADVLETAGVKLDIGPHTIANCIEQVGVGFMFAPLHHSAMRHAIGARKELAVRTIFNVLGPLTNPAAAPNQVIGVFSDDLLDTMAEVLLTLGSEHVMVVRSEDGMDEISISAPTNVVELHDGQIKRYQISPSDFDMSLASLDDLRVDSPEHSLQVIQDVLDNQPGPAFDVVCLNAGAALYVAGVAESHKAGVDLARAAIKHGKAKEVLNRLIAVSNS